MVAVTRLPTGVEGSVALFDRVGVSVTLDMARDERQSCIHSLVQ